MITISIDDRSVLDVLARLHGRIADLTPAWDQIGMEIETRVSARFEAERDPSGQAWAPWAERTRASYPEDGNGRILDRLGDMLDSLNYQADQDGVTIGFSKDYAVYHEYGTKHMPRRGLLMEDPEARRLSGEDEQTVLDILGRHLAP